MYNFSVCVMDNETYDNIIANSEEEAKMIAVDNFCNDDLWYGSEETENVTVNDCAIVWMEEC